jgi:hypothetical protein
MGLQKVWWDDWKGPVYDEHEVENPDWERVESAIRDLDADRRTMVRLVANNGQELLLGGGNGQFVVTAMLDDDNHVSARDETRPTAEIELTVGGQTGVYSGQMVWDIDTALRAAKTFWQDNTLDPQLTWSSP